MNLEILIEKHNKVLDEKVNCNSFLRQRILNGLISNKSKKESSFNMNFGKSILKFGILIVIFIFLNFTFVGELEKLKTQTFNSIDLEIKPFQTDFQISLNSMLKEIIK